MDAQGRRDLVFLVLAGIFITNAILGEVMGGKLITFGPFAMSIGVIPWPVVFLTTDLINEYFGRAGVRNNPHWERESTRVCRQGWDRSACPSLCSHRP